jgi:hypothetical protein
MLARDDVDPPRMKGHLKVGAPVEQPPAPLGRMGALRRRLQVIDGAEVLVQVIHAGAAPERALPPDHHALGVPAL